MYNIFNMGIGMAIIVDQEDVEKAMSVLVEAGEQPHVIGEVTASEGVQLV
ncbi:MAG: AIR synthase-related protein [Bacillota bacterium]|nr:AIR synthase-related protein [Bacillota bacterium]